MRLIKFYGFMGRRAFISIAIVAVRRYAEKRTAWNARRLCLIFIGRGGGSKRKAHERSTDHMGRYRSLSSSFWRYVMMSNPVPEQSDSGEGSARKLAMVHSFTEAPLMALSSITCRDDTVGREFGNRKPPILYVVIVSK